MSHKHPDELGMAPVHVDGKRYWISHHAAGRALDMNVPLKLFPAILRNGEWFDAPANSKYPDARVVRSGKVSLGVIQSTDGPIITTVLWGTTEAWRDADHQAGREYRGDEWTASVLAKWFGETA